MKYTLGYVAWADRIASSDAVVVQSLRKAGEIVYVKTTMPQTGMVRAPKRS
jgi:amidase